MAEAVSQKFVYAFEEGVAEQKYLLGGKGANLAEMTNLGLPVPPGFTISTDACKAYMAAGDTLPGRAHGRGRRRARRARTEDGQAPRRRGRPAARVGPFRRAVLDARDDGHRPQPRAQRRLGEGPRRSRRTTSGSRSTRTAGSCRCSARSCSTCPATCSKRRCTTSSRRRDSRSRPSCPPPTSRGSSRRSRAIVEGRSGRRLPGRPDRAARVRDRSRLQVVERPPRDVTTGGWSASRTTSAPP